MCKGMAIGKSLEFVLVYIKLMHSKFAQSLLEKVRIAKLKVCSKKCSNPPIL
jgi:hypothetical protein